MARMREVERAKRRLMKATTRSDWMLGAGIARVDGKLGLVINVQSGKDLAAKRALRKIDLRVPVTIRIIEEIKASARTAGESDADTIVALRNAAVSRLKR